MRRVHLFVFILMSLLLVQSSGQAQNVQNPDQEDQEIGATPQTQTQTGASIATLSGWLIGSWTGRGLQRGINFTSTLTVKPDLDGQILVFERSSQYGYKDIVIVGYEQTSNKYLAALFSNKNRSAVYTCQPGPNVLVLTQVGDAKQVLKKTMKLTGNGSMNFKTEQISSDGQSKILLEINFTKTS